MATWTPQSKTATTFNGQSFSNLTQWASPSILWADTGVGWGAFQADVFVNQVKNSTVLANQVKN